jgi:hypothetical protein
VKSLEKIPILGTDRKFFTDSITEGFSEQAFEDVGKIRQC